MEERRYLDCKHAVSEDEKDCPIYNEKPELEEPFRRENKPILNTVKEGKEYLPFFHMDLETKGECLDICRACDNFDGC